VVWWWWLLHLGQFTLGLGQSPVLSKVCPRTKMIHQVKRMSENIVVQAPAPLTGFDLWTPNDYSNFITICAAAVGSTLLVVFKSKCVKISVCFGLWSCDREVTNSDSDEDEAIVPPQGAANDQP